MDWDPMKTASAWDFTKLEIQDGPTHLPPGHAHLANNDDGITTEAVHSGGLFSVDLKLGRVMDDDYDHMISSSTTSMDVAAAAAIMSSSSSSSTSTAAGGLMHHQAGLSMSRRSGRGGVDGALPVYSCSVDGCTWDLSGCREYHRRHRVCERHSKTPVVLVRGEEQRFCQQCSRFHPLREFDEAKRSCRKRLDGHNRRRRKKQRDTTGEYSAAAAHSNSSSSSVINNSLLTTATQSPGSALMEFIRNAPPFPWPMAAPLPPHDRPQEGFFFPTSPAASSSYYPLITPGYVGGFEDQTQIIRSTHHNYTANNNHNIMDHDEDEDDDQHHHQSSMICHHHQPQVINTNIDCALSLLSSAAATAPMDDHPHCHQELDDDVGTSTTTAAAAIVNESYGSALFHHHHHQQHHHVGGQRFDPNNQADGSSSRVFHFDNWE